MSYANAAAKNRLPPEQQPHPDPRLLEGDHHDPNDVDLSHSTNPDEKVHVVTREEFDREAHPASDTSTAASSTTTTTNTMSSSNAPRYTADDAAADAQAAKTNVEQGAKKAANQASANASQAKKDLKRDAEKAGDAAADAFNKAGDKTADTIAKAADEGHDLRESAKKEIKQDAKQAEKSLDKAAQAAKDEYEVMSDKAKSAYNKMSKEARDDWHKLSKESKKRWEEAKNSEVGQELQKPEVWGSMLAIANLAVVGGVAWAAVSNWHKPRWDRGVVSATVLGVGTWFGLQGWLIPQTEPVKRRRAA